MFKIDEPDDVLSPRSGATSSSCKCEQESVAEITVASADDLTNGIKLMNMEWS